MDLRLGNRGIDPAFWKGRRVLVTGHTGFKGSWLCLWLERLGALVTGYATAPPTNPNLFELARVAQSVPSITGDVRDAEHFRRVVLREQPEIILHLAAQPLVRRGYAEPIETFSTNVMGTVHVLDAVRCSDHVRAVVIVTSDKCYRNQGWTRGYCETDPLGGHDPYSSSKGCAELVTSAFRNSYFQSKPTESAVGIASGRAGNVIGGGDWACDRLIPDIIRAFAASQPVLIRNPRSVRPWQHVLEPLRGYLLLAQQLYDNPAVADGWNFGPPDDDAQPVAWVVDRLVELWGGNASWSSDVAVHPREDQLLRLDCSRAVTQLGWCPTLTLSRALEWTVEWYRAQLGGQDVRELTLEQIARYEALLDTISRSSQDDELSVAVAS